MGEPKRKDLPPDWRPNWRPPKKRSQGGKTEADRAAERLSRAGARARVVEPIPPREELKERGVAVLLSVAEDVCEETRDRVNAASKLVEFATRDKIGGTDPSYENLPLEELEARQARILEQWAQARGMRLLPAAPEMVAVVTDEEAPKGEEEETAAKGDPLPGGPVGGGADSGEEGKR